MNQTRTPTAISFQELTANSFADFEKLFESTGGPKHCWCMAWRRTAEEAKHAGSGSLKAAMSSRVMMGTPVGILGYMDGQPVAWCSVAPRSTHRRLVSDGSSDDGVWSITCFFVTRSLRGSAISKQLLAAATGHAQRRGAEVIESYPVDHDSPSYRFMGFVSMFAGAGFVQVGHEGKRRKVMRISVGAQHERDALQRT